MPTTAELRELGNCQVGLIVVMDGIEPAFADNADLVNFDTGSDHVVRLGLTRDGLQFRMAVDLRTSLFLDSPASFTIQDHQGDLAALWRAVDPTEQELSHVPFGAGAPIEAGEDLTGRTDLHEMNVGLERLGSTGERHRFAVPPGFEIGLQHFTSNESLSLAGAPVSEEPIVWNGRRIALYRVYRDHVTYPDRSTGASSWRPFSEAVLLWWGTMRDAGRVSGREWQLECDGPESWLRKPLALGWQKEPVTAIGDVTLVSDGDERETAIAIELRIPGGGIGFDTYSIRNYLTDITATTMQGIIDEVRAEINTAAADASLDGPFEDVPGCSLSMDTHASIKIETTTIVDAAAQMLLSMHRKVWAILGYDVDLQRQLDPATLQYVEFFPAGIGYFSDPAPSADYWIGRFVTGESDSVRGLNNGGVVRRYDPLYEHGTQVLLAGLNDGRGQVFRLADATLGANTSQSTVAHPGQLMRPVAGLPSDPVFQTIEIDGQPCNRTGFWLFFGKRRLIGPDGTLAPDVFDSFWIGEASWFSTGNGLVNGDVIIVTRWWPSEMFGFSNRGGNSTDWVARAYTGTEEEGYLQAVPIAVLGYSDGLDKAHVVMQRLLQTTGTATGWNGPSGDPSNTLTAGANEPVAAPNVRRDAEVAALGLGIPASMVATGSEFAAVADRIETGNALDVKAAFSSGYQAVDALRALMQPLGWCWTLRGGRYGIFCPADPLGLADAEFVLDRSVRQTKYSKRGGREIEQDIREWQPIDKFVFDRSWAPHLNKTGIRVEIDSPDHGHAYRPGEVSPTVPAHWHRGPATASGVIERVHLVASFWAKRHFKVKGYEVPMLAFEDCWPGSICRITDPELVDVLGSYGVTNRIAIVTATSTRMGLNEGTKTLDLLVLADPSVTPRLHAPIARAFGYNSATNRISVSDNAFSIEGYGSDEDAFIEPTYTGIAAFGGDAVIEIFQWDGDTWAQTCSGTVDSVGAGYIELTGAITGTYRRDMDSIVVLRPTTTANAAWVDTLYSPISDDTGQWTDVATPTDGYNWEP